MATPLICTEAKRTCKESLAFRATVSPPHLRRILPKPALPPLDGPTPAQLLRELLKQLDGPRAALHTRMANQALEDADSEAIARALRQVQREVDDRREAKEKLHKTFPLP